MFKKKDLGHSAIRTQIFRKPSTLIQSTPARLSAGAIPALWWDATVSSWWRVFRCANVLPLDPVPFLSSIEKAACLVGIYGDDVEFNPAPRLSYGLS
jgi:hypothetical protein